MNIIKCSLVLFVITLLSGCALTSKEDITTGKLRTIRYKAAGITYFKSVKSVNPYQPQ